MNTIAKLVSYTKKNQYTKELSSPKIKLTEKINSLR